MTRTCRTGDAFLRLSRYGNFAGEKLDWNTPALGFVPGTQVLNAENSTTLPANDGPLNLVLPGPYGTRLIKMR